MNNADAISRKGLDHIGIVVCFFCHDGNGKFLVHRRGRDARNYAGYWDVGGGTVELGERLEDALLRELQEEYGIVPRSYELLGHREYVDDEVLGHWIAFDYAVLVDPATVVIQEPDKVEALQWVRIDDVPDPKLPQLIVASEMWQDKLGNYS